MEAKAIAKYVRISPLKVNFICKEIRGKQVDEALAILRYTPKRGAKVLKKVLTSAVANAENNFNLDRENLYVAEAYANDGPTLKRWRPRAKGMAYPILKRSSHIGVTVKEKE
ncbi:MULTISPECIES: 50S ribosomal protein L22 [Tissierellales]|uniref:Large ribosomal subunit protein uL22 n=1 Tax=Acidilutibacter cellobiosedens TaxID=2507161 RepID=A0A410QFQ3_9FIRM|nr:MULTISPECIES: 50S ribosomal protein L22 [Tissierellales]MBE6082741.1 50S ribosomal protein L22 [Tissierellaceae bacterium]QAT62668.1 50S ribosomal protein L22 [Acidilutibacter cellobiosedens]SCL90131.1 50S ribosomal protein L22 [Sporanaerobacter sp. PP17-6a]